MKKDILKRFQREDKKDISIAISLALIFIFTTVLVSSFVSAEFWACFSRGERINFCNERTLDRTCGGDTCIYCMNNYNSEKGCYNQAFYNRCNSMAPQCIFSGNGSNVDMQPPVLSIFSPNQGGVYTTRSVLLNFRSDERADIFYIDRISGRGRWTKVCDNCMSYGRSRSFREGLNDLIIRVVDVVGNDAFYNISFYVDTRKPKIRGTEPRREFANGMFNVAFNENNPKIMLFYYGNNINGFKYKELDLTRDCTIGRERICNTNVDLSIYNEQNIEYWFNLTDIAGNSVLSKKVSLIVDTSLPIINSLDYHINRRKVHFLINIEEEHFDSVEYIDNSSNRARWINLCSRLKNGVCEKEITLREGRHDIKVRIADESGNSVDRDIQITI